MKLESGSPTGDIANRWEKHKFDMKLVNPANKRKHRVIIVGSGLAGGSAAATIPTLLALRPISRWIPPISGAILLFSGTLTLLARWI